MNINNPTHINPKLVSNNLGTLETNGNLKLTEEAIKQSQAEAAAKAEQERIRQAQENARARVLNALGFGSIQSLGLVRTQA